MSVPHPTHDLSYPLAAEPDGRSWTARENLVDILSRELLGPAGGPEEIIEGAPDSAYLIGRIAPVRLTAGQDDPTQADSDDAVTDVGDAVDAAESRGVPLTAVDDSSASSEEDEVEDQPQKRGLMIPASMGLRCQIPNDLDAFTVITEFGTYEPVKEKQSEGGEPVPRLRRYQRIPHSFSTTVKVVDLMPLQTKTYVLKDKVLLRVDRYDDVERGCRLIEIALCNDRETPRKIPVEAWLYQTQLSVKALDGAAVFLPVNDALLDNHEEPDDELRRLRLQYRNRLEFAVGRTCSVDWTEIKDTRRAAEVRTTWLPVSETPQTAAEEISSAMLDMRALEEATPDELRAGLEPIVKGYASWLDAEEQRARDLPGHLTPEALEAVRDARRVQMQLAKGLEFLLADEEQSAEALRCFRFMNRVMADQRVQSQVAQRRAGQSEESRETLDEAIEAIKEEKGAKAHSWRTFQLAFILMQLPLLFDPAAEKRSGDLAKAQLLFFPTGGGKTEAYLGLAAYTFAVRRRQGIVDAFDGPLDGRSGVAVLMRYTLRLLTAQQFQRATALVCAAERARMEDPATWGNEPFRIGLWVGTDVSPKRYDEAAKQLEKANQGHGYRLTVLQVQRCPWCGTRIEARDVRADQVRRRVYVYCGDELADCPFAEGGEVAEGLPILTVDEEIYRLAPAFVIATVDKFARLAREGEAASLFGYVSRRCERHGFVHPDYQQCDIKDGSKHPKKDGLPAAAVHPVARLRPPDLIIQDELHLITGALGTTVGLFEVAIDVMTDWRTKDGRPVRPLLVASTATARNAADQVKALYGRDVTIFPPQVLDAGNTFFSKEIEVSKEAPGRRYVGISTTGVRLTTAEIRVAEVLMAGGQLLLDRSGKAADPYMTLVGYFSATRELAGMARYMGDDIQTALAKRRPWSRLPSRTGTDFGALHVAELTSRVASADITSTLDQMAVRFDPEFDSTAGKRNLRALREAKARVPERDVSPYDVVLATSMLQVGVDVTRLGLMLVVGQPKNTAEYIQASSRVGRDADRPGLVVALGNWARPRDLAHFEQFRHYHETFYAQVEALSVTPFSVTSLERGLDGVLVSAARVLQAVRAQSLSPESGADRIETERHFAVDLVDALVRRVARAGDEDAAGRARELLSNRLDQWGKRRKHLVELRKSLVYEKVVDDSQHDALMMSAENAKSGVDTRDAPPFIVPNSMREVQPEINLLVSPIKDRLVYIEPMTAPQWVMPEEKS
ncbi:DISARM system helicase DrmA [Streptomyces sp. NPDC006355]|uniref:DISARM system helicase DrmA n=1 Tax=Streptomyces sp. NPDC006355 TaxID=3156758 RepID=UPI0033A7B26B